MKDETTYGLGPERLARLLAIGLESESDEDDSHADRSFAEALKEMLAREPSLDPAMPDSLPAVLNRPCDGLVAVTGLTMGDLLLDSKTDLVIIKALKDYGKELVRRRGQDAKHTAATAICYAAIASALVFHRHKITQHSYEKLDKSFTELEQKPWVSPELKDLFEKAQAICGQRKKGAG